MTRFSISFINRPEYQKFQEEFNKESDRGAAVLGCVYLEGFITKILKKKLIGGSDLIKNRTTKQKIDFFKMLGLINNDIIEDLNHILEIRNTFAHDVNFNSFDDSKISNLCSGFNIIRVILKSGVKIKIPTPRAKYNIAIGLYILKLEQILNRTSKFIEATDSIILKQD